MEAIPEDEVVVGDKEEPDEMRQTLISSGSRWDSLYKTGRQSALLAQQQSTLSMSSEKKEEKERKEDKEDKAEKKKKKKERESAANAALAGQLDDFDINDNDERYHEVQGLEPRFVGLIIGKAGETIKSFKKNTGCSIEIDQNLPEGLPRVIIFRGTRKQIAAARKQVETLLQKTKDEERSRDSSGVPIPGHLDPGMSKQLLNSLPKEAKESLIVRGVLPAGDGPQRGSLTGEGAESAMWRREQGLQRQIRNPAQQKKRREDGPAALGSLTSMTMALGRPDWLQTRKSAEEIQLTHNPETYRRSLMLAVRKKLLRGRAYEVPALMTLMTMPRALAESSLKIKDEKASQPSQPSTGSPNAWTN